MTKRITNNRYEPSDTDMNTPYFRAYGEAIALVPRPPRPITTTYIQPKIKRAPILVLLIVLMVAMMAVSFILPSLFEFVAAEDSEEANIEIGIVDVFTSLLKSFSIIETDEETTLYFYDMALSNAEEQETVIKLAYYAIPIALVLTFVIGVYIIIKSINALASPKRRKFPYILLLLLLFGLLGVAGGFVWGQQPIGDLVSFATGSSSVMILGLAYLAILGIQALALILSLFAYKSKKKTVPYYLGSDGVKYEA